MTDSVTIAQRRVERVVLRNGAQPQMIVGAGTRTRVVVSYRGVPGRDGAALGSYVHVQNSASATWTVNHNLGRFPGSVRVLSPGGVEVEAEVLDISSSQLSIRFAAPAAGRAIIT